MNRLLIVLTTCALAAASWLPAASALAPENPVLSAPTAAFACLVTGLASLGLGAWTRATTQEGPGGAASAGAAVTCAAWSFGGAPVLAAATQAAVMTPVQSAPDAVTVLTTSLSCAIQTATLWLIPAGALAIPVGVALGWLGGWVAKRDPEAWAPPRAVTLFAAFITASVAAFDLAAWQSAMQTFADSIGANSAEGMQVLPLAPLRAMLGTGDAAILVTSALALTVVGVWLRTWSAIGAHAPWLILLALLYVPPVVILLAISVSAALPMTTPVVFTAALGGACLAMGLPLRARSSAPMSPAELLQLALICSVAWLGPSLLDMGVALAMGAIERIVDITASGSLAAPNTTLVPELVAMMRWKALGSLATAIGTLGLFLAASAIVRFVAARRQAAV